MESKETEGQGGKGGCVVRVMMLIDWLVSR